MSGTATADLTGVVHVIVRSTHDVVSVEVSCYQCRSWDQWKSHQHCWAWWRRQWRGLLSL